MHTDENQTDHRTRSIPGWLFPCSGLVAVIASILIFIYWGDRIVWLAYVLGGLGAGLGFAFFILTLARRHERSKMHSAGSLILAVLLMAFAGITILVEDFIANFSIFGPPQPPSLAVSLENAATSAAGAARSFLTDGKSGPLVGSDWQDSHWTNPDGGALSIAISWSKNTKGIMVTATPVGDVPPGQDGTPANQQVLRNGMLELPLNFYEQKGQLMKSSSFDLFSPEFFFFNDLIQDSAKPIIEYAQAHEGKLPDPKRADEILSKVKTVYEFNPDSTPMATDSQVIRFVITKYAFQPMSDDMFSIVYDWEYSTPNKPPTSDPDFKATGTLTLHYTADGKLAMNSTDSDNPLYQLLESVQRQGAAEEAREQGTKEKPRGEKPAAEK